MDVAFPDRQGAVISFQATFGATVAQFSWNEFGIDIESSPPAAAGTTVADLLLNHRTQIGQGLKPVGQIWIAAATVSFGSAT